MEQMKSKVYALPDVQNRITRIDGGYTVGNIRDFNDWVLIDEGSGDKYNLCQSNYLDKPIMDNRGVYQYKLVNGKPVERTQKEMDDDYNNRPPAPPTQMDIIEAQTMYTAMMTDTLLEE